MADGSLGDVIEQYFSTRGTKMRNQTCSHVACALHDDAAALKRSVPKGVFASDLNPGEYAQSRNRATIAHSTGGRTTAKDVRGAGFGDEVHVGAGGADIRRGDEEAAELTDERAIAAQEPRS